MQRRTPLLAILLCLVGCQGGGSPFDYIPVTGSLTYEDGSPLPKSGIRIQFVPQDIKPVGDAHPKVATADVDAEGRFAHATSYKYADGLIRGKYKVAIFYATDANGKLLIPKEYTHADTTPLEIEASELPLNIKVPRP